MAIRKNLQKAITCALAAILLGIVGNVLLRETFHWNLRLSLVLLQVFAASAGVVATWGWMYYRYGDPGGYYYDVAGSMKLEREDRERQRAEDGEGT